MPRHFLSKDFEILDLDPPNNPTSHYGACHFGYNLALKGIIRDLILLKLSKDFTSNKCHSKKTDYVL